LAKSAEPHAFDAQGPIVFELQSCWGASPRRATSFQSVKPTGKYWQHGAAGVNLSAPQSKWTFSTAPIMSPEMIFSGWVGFGGSLNLPKHAAV